MRMADDYDFEFSQVDDLYLPMLPEEYDACELVGGDCDACTCYDCEFNPCSVPLDELDDIE